MDTSASASSPGLSPLETFVRDYVETVGGVWDEVEPQVYDVLLPGQEAPSQTESAGRVLQLAFDPEALAEHPAAQLATFGTPLMDQLLAEAIRGGASTQLYVVGLNLAPHNLTDRIRRALQLPAGLTVRPERVRALHFAQAVFWFEATFVSDQKEQEILPLALDLHYGREVRHLDTLLDRSRFAEHPALPLPEARRLSLAAAYPQARERVLRSLAALANIRSRELTEQVDRQIARMTRYYADLRDELEESLRRSRSKNEDLAKFAARRQALEREERLRIAELRQKSTLRVQLRLLHVLLLQQPKLLLQCGVEENGRPVAHLELVWDPLPETLEAAACPECQRPTFVLARPRSGRLVCPTCAAAPPPARKSAPR